MKKYDVVIIGGGPAGVTAAISARNAYSDKTIALIRKENIALIPCGIPYVFGTLKQVEDDILPDAPLKKNNVDLIVDEVMEKEGNVLKLKSGEKIEYKKLVIATGSKPFVPPIPGIEKNGVYFVKKDMKYLKELKEKLKDVNNIVIIGGGFIGVEFADELLKMGKKVMIIEKLPSLLPLAMDKEFGDMAIDVLKEMGANVVVGKSVKEITGDEKVDGVIMEDGTRYDADMVIVAAGYRPNLDLAIKFGLDVDKRYGIIVDEYLRTSDKDIFAVGDCAAKKSWFSGDYSNIMLASTAMAQGRLAGSNLFEIKVIKGFYGTLGTFSTKIGNTAFGVSGLTRTV